MSMKKHLVIFMAKNLSTHNLNYLHNFVRRTEKLVKPRHQVYSSLCVQVTFFWFYHYCV